MAITISGENNNDKILASDGVIDQISGINFSGIITASHIDVGSNIQLGNAGIVTATTFIGNLTGNVNTSSNLLLQIGGSEKFRVGSSGQLGIGGANYGTSGQVLTSGGSGSAASWSTISTDLVNDSSPQLGADLDTNGFGILVDDNKVVNFGNNNDLMIYHSGTHSYIKNKTNNLYIMSTNTEYGIEVHGNGKVRLNYDNSPKIETTNTGAVVTGILTATSRVSLGNNTTNAVDLEFGTNRGSAGDTLANINWKWNNTYVAQIRGMAGSDTTNKDDAHLNFYTAAAGSLVERLRITKDGDFVMHSASPNHDTSTGSIFMKAPSGNPNRGIKWSDTSDTHYVKLEPSVIDGLTINGYSGVAFATGSRSNSTWAERIRIDSTGALRVNTTRTTATKLHVVGGTASGTAYDVAVFAGGQNSTQNSGVKLYLSGCENDPISRGVILESIMTDNSNAHRFSILVGGSSAAPTERFRITPSGAHFYGNQTNLPNGIFGFRYDKNNDTDLSIENLNNSSVNNNAGIRLASNHGNIKLRYFNNGGFYIQNSSDSGYLHYYEGNNSRFYVSTNGNIGINETSPQQLLHVHNDTNYQGILINGNVAPRIAFARTTTTTGEWSVGIDGTNGNNFAINNSNDNSNNKIIISSSQVSLYGHVGVPNGNIIMGSGRGIDFSATADATHTAVTSGHNPSTDSEVLTDYEHGTWTPRLRAYDHTGGAGWGTMVYTDGTEVTGTGRYVKMGRYVWAGFKFESGSKVFDSGWTYWSIDNVPYGANHYDKASGSCYVNQTNFFTDSNSHIGGFVHGSDAYMIVNKPNGHSNATINTSNNNRYCYGHISIYSSRY